MTIENLSKCKKVYLLGYGIEGKATHAFLKKFCPHVEVGIGDIQHDPQYLERQAEYDLVIKSPGIRLDKVIGTYTTATNIFFANNTRFVIGITGTKGKSTTATLVHNMLLKAGRASVLAGNIGVPMLDILTNELPTDATVVLELSSYQLEDIAYSPDISVVLNVYEELHNHTSFDEYRNAKYRISHNATNKDLLIYNPQVPQVELLLKETDARKVPFEDVQSDIYFNKSINQDSVAVLLHLADALDIDYPVVQEALDSFKGLSHRLEDIGEYNNISFINDSAANHPRATEHALRVTNNVATIMLGGQDRGFDFSGVVALLAQKKVTNVILFPDTQDSIVRLIENIPEYTPQIFYTDSMPAAVNYAFENSPSGSTCLLSPGAPSYLMFTGFTARGEAFVQAIRAYAQKTS